MTIRDIAIALGFEIDKNSEKNVESSVNKIKSFTTKALGAIGIVLSIAGVSELAETAAEAEALKSQFTQVFGDMESEATTRLEKIADNTGVAVNRMKGSFVQIAAFAKTTGMEQAQALELSDRAMKAVADSAAFYDRSLEEVTDSLQSFLKGNFENDAALGLSCTETTRNAAANALYGKSFKDLAEDQKQLTLLKMVEDANKASGALGQAARESDTWTNQLGNLKQSLVDLKAAAGQGILKPAVQVLKLLNGMVQKATVSITVMTSKNGILTRSFNFFFGIVKKLKPAVDRLYQTFSGGVSKGYSVLQNLVERFGGLENVLKIATIAVLAFLAVMGVAKIISFMKAIGGLTGIMSKLGKIFSIANLKVLAIVAIIVILALIIEDFINFMMGNDSVIGAFFDKTGIGADNARQAILEAWQKIKTFSIEIWNAIKDTLFAVLQAIYEVICTILDAIVIIIKVIFTGIKTFWSAWGTEILAWFQKIFTNLGEILKGFLEVIQGIANFITAVFTGDWQGAWEAVKQIFFGIWQMIVAFAKAIWETIKLLFKMGLSAIKALWETIWGAISSFFQGIWNGIVSFLSSVLSNLLSGITTTVGNIKNAIVNGFTEAINWIKSLPSQALTWGADIVDGIAKGITGAIGKITDAVKGVANKITSFLHFSVPDEGPLTEYESWMPDMMEGLGRGIDGSKHRVLDRIKSFAGDMSMLMKSATANAGTASNTTNSSKVSIIQNNEFNNTYSGGDMKTQENISKGMKKSADDATTQLAKGLVYAR